MPTFLLALFRLIRLLSSGHQAEVLENLALRQQLAIYKRKQKAAAPAATGWFWMALAKTVEGRTATFPGIFGYLHFHRVGAIPSFRRFGSPVDRF